MRKYYFAAFIPEENGGYSIVIPDIPNAVTCGDSLEEGMDMAADVLAMLLRDMVENNQPVPEPSEVAAAKAKVARHLQDIEHKAAGEIMYQLIQAPSLDMVPVKLSISMPKAVLAEIDSKAKAYGYTRSGFLVHAAQTYHAED